MAGPVTLRTDDGDEELDLPEFEARVRRGEVSPQGLVRFAPLTGPHFVPACDLALYQQALAPRQAVFQRTFGFTRFPWATSALVLANLAVFALVERGAPVTRDLIEAGAKVAPLVLDLGQLWRLLTANVLHHDAWHIGLNLFVLFHVGGALENIYRLTDYLWLLVLCGLGAMTASLALSEGITSGASGLVFGCLGCLVAFGLKYRALLPARYQSLLGEAAIPSVLLLFLIGVTSRGVDAWAHLGGLVTGLALGMALTPGSLLASGWTDSWTGWLRLGATVGAVLLLPRLGWRPPLQLLHDDAWGVELALPAGWLRSVDPFGALASYNGLPQAGRATAALQVSDVPEGADPRQEAQRFVELRLVPGTLGEEALAVAPGPVRATQLAGRDAVTVVARLETASEPRLLKAHFLARGQTAVQLTFTWPASLPGYEAVVDAAAASLRLEEPARARQARAQALLFPGARRGLEVLGGELLALGDTDAALLALHHAPPQPARPEVLARLALAHLRAGDPQGGCPAVLALPPAQEPQVALTRALCLAALEDAPAAARALKAARLAFPHDSALEALESRWRHAGVQSP